jgi:hypothetical protein
VVKHSKKKKMNMRFVVRHLAFVVKNPRKAWATVKAMRQYAKEHPFCELTGTSPIEVYHVEPIEVAPERAADPTNFISLGARKIHLVAGHAGNWKWHVVNVREICRLAQIAKH